MKTASIIFDRRQLRELLDDVSQALTDNQHADNPRRGDRRIDAAESTANVLFAMLVRDLEKIET